jgi:hypothetical protein
LWRSEATLVHSFVPLTPQLYSIFCLIPTKIFGHLLIAVRSFQNTILQFALKLPEFWHLSGFAFKSIEVIGLTCVGGGVLQQFNGNNCQPAKRTQLSLNRTEQKHWISGLHTIVKRNVIGSVLLGYVKVIVGVLGSDVLRPCACWRTQNRGFLSTTTEGEEQHLSFFPSLNVQ